MSVLQRKAQVGKQEHMARAMTVPKALRVALAKVADKSLEMALAVIGVTQERWSGDEIEAKTDTDKLLLLLDGPFSETGGAVLDQTLVRALVQQQTMGRVFDVTNSDRPMTSTDAALCAPLLDALFDRAHGLLEAPEDRDAMPAYKFGARAGNPRLFGLAMGQPEYHVLHLTIDIAAGVAQAKMSLILPVPEKKPEPVSEDSEDAASNGALTVENAVMDLKADLTAVLCRIRLSLSQVSQLVPGDALSVPIEAFDEVEVLSIEGKRIASGAMGQVDGHRALMLSPPGAEMAQEGGLDEALELDEEVSDYTNLNLPDLQIPASPEMLDPGSFDIDDGAGLPDLPDLPDMDDDGSSGLPDLPDLPDYPDTTGQGEHPPDLEDLPKLNIA